MPSVLLEQPCQFFSGHHAASDSDFNDTVLGCFLWWFDLHRQTTFDRLTKVLRQLVQRLSLRGTTGNRGYFSPMAAFFGLVHNRADLHQPACYALVYPRAKEPGNGEGVAQTREPNRPLQRVTTVREFASKSYWSRRMSPAGWSFGAREGSPPGCSPTHYVDCETRGILHCVAERLRIT